MAYDSALLTRPYWGGADKDVDLHIEEHTGIVDQAFQYTSKLAPYMNIRSLRNSNALRIDRLGAATVLGRRVGEALTTTDIKQEKFTLAVDTTVFHRKEMDLFDEWTANLDLRREYAQAAGTALAKQYDRAALIAALKAPNFVPPSSLEGAFNSGILTTAALTGSDSEYVASEDNAEAIVRAHRQGIEQLVERDLGDEIYGGGGITFVSPRMFSILLEHSKLLNVEYGATGGDNNFVRGRVAILNGVRVMETPRIPTAAVTYDPLGDAFLVSAAEARRQIITMVPSLALITAQVRPLESRIWRDDRNFSDVLDTYQAYNIGARRPDAIAVVDVSTSA